MRQYRIKRNPYTTQPDLPNEQWKTIPSHGDYAVSDLGRVRRLTPNKGARIGKVQTGSIGTHGYPVVSLGRQKRHTVHSLVALAFIGPCPPGHEVNHKDGVKTNPRLTNLEYVTFKENVQHAFQIGLVKSGERHHLAKLTDQKAREIYRLAHEGVLTQREIGRMFGVAQSTVGHIKSKRDWSHIH